MSPNQAIDYVINRIESTPPERGGLVLTDVELEPATGFTISELRKEIENYLIEEEFERYHFSYDSLAVDWSY